MKRLTRAEFLKQPKGTLYFKESERSLCIKDDTVANVDWYYMDLAAIEPPAADGRDWADAVYEAETAMLNDKVSMPPCDTLVRDGSFDENETFFVYELMDLVDLQQKLAAAVRALP